MWADPVGPARMPVVVATGLARRGAPLLEVGDGACYARRNTDLQIYRFFILKTIDFFRIFKNGTFISSTVHLS